MERLLGKVEDIKGHLEYFLFEGRKVFRHAVDDRHVERTFRRRLCEVGFDTDTLENMARAEAATMTARINAVYEFAHVWGGCFHNQELRA
eukprot:scaffold1307_cov151-Amphora_coffeaeformis.AAC.7